MTDRNGNAGEIEFTEEARRELESWSRRVEKELVLRARLYAEGRGSGVIERRDVSLASRSLMGHSEEVVNRRTNRRYPLIFQVAVMVAPVLVAAFIVYQGLDNSDAWSSVLGVYVGVLGLVLAAYMQLREMRETEVSGSVSLADESVDIAEVLAVWRDIEKILREDGPYDEVDTHRLSVGNLVIEYAKKYHLGGEFVNEVRGLLRVRNRLVHGGNEPLPHSEVRKNLQAARRVLLRISAIRAAREGEQDDEPVEE